jgi:hypothetical protein
VHSVKGGCRRGASDAIHVQGLAPTRCTAVQYDVAAKKCMLLEKNAFQTTNITASNIKDVFAAMKNTTKDTDVYAEQVRCN